MDCGGLKEPCINGDAYRSGEGATFGRGLTCGLSPKFRDHLFVQLEKQRKMNELDVVVTVRLHQLEHVVNGAVPTDLSQCLTFEAPALVSLHRRIDELEQERIVQKRQHQYDNHNNNNSKQICIAP